MESSDLWTIRHEKRVEITQCISPLVLRVRVSMWGPGPFLWAAINTTHHLTDQQPTLNPDPNPVPDTSGCFKHNYENAKQMSPTVVVWTVLGLWRGFNGGRREKMACLRRKRFDLPVIWDTEWNGVAMNPQRSIWRDFSPGRFYIKLDLAPQFFLE